MNDLISRKAAIDRIDGLYRDTTKNESYMITGYNHAVSDVLATIKSLPSAQQEQTGRWSQVSGQATLCSCCGRASNAKQARNWSYCPYCGKKMEEMK